ncbi:MAG TPA: SRPBCC family protein [Candidatus Obscuribacterales bacterium]
MGQLQLFQKSCDLPIDVGTAFNWHKRPDAFSLMTSKFPPVKILQREAGITDGAKTTVQVGLAPAAFVWTLEHCDYIEGKQFCDRQLSGPFEKWYHMHLFEPIDDRSCRLIDRIEYVLPLQLDLLPGPALIMQMQLDQMFGYRHRALRRSLIPKT